MYYVGNIPCTPYDIRHHGILGMKWGVRRYQNSDGSLTDAGKRRYGGETVQERGRALKRLNKDSVKLQKQFHKQMSRTSAEVLWNKKMNPANLQKDLDNMAEIEKRVRGLDSESWKHIGAIVDSGRDVHIVGMEKSANSTYHRGKVYSNKFLIGEQKAEKGKLYVTTPEMYEISKQAQKISNAKQGQAYGGKSSSRFKLGNGAKRILETGDKARNMVKRERNNYKVGNGAKRILETGDKARNMVERERDKLRDKYQERYDDYLRKNRK